MNYEIKIGQHVQSSPDCYALFLRFRVRNTLNQTKAIFDFDDRLLAEVIDPFPVNEGRPPGIVHKQDKDFLAVEQLPVRRDIVSCSVRKSKSRAAGTWEMSLAPGDEYDQLIHPGDHVFVWMKRNRGKAKFSNDFDSGLKCYGVVGSVVKQTAVDSQGQRHTRYNLTGEDFGHFFETDIYYDPVLAQPLKDLGTIYRSLGGAGTTTWYSPSTNLNILLNAYIGQSLDKSITPEIGSEILPNDVFRLPGEVGQIFKVLDSKLSLSSLLQRHIGVLQYRDDSWLPDSSVGLQGTKIFKIEPGQQSTAWSVLENYSNRTLNEMYCDLKPTDFDGKLYPTFVCRQLPYTTNVGARALEQERSGSVADPIPFTQFESLPKWSVPQSMILSEETQKDSHMRFNYIQMHGFGVAGGLGGSPLSGMQTNFGNFALDRDSISRHGLKPMIVQTDYDLTAESIKRATETQQEIAKVNAGATTTAFRITEVPRWIKLYADWFLPVHLYFNASFNCLGIEEPIGIGDNFEIMRAGTAKELYHIDSYAHEYSVQGDGVKSFRTNLHCVRGRFTKSGTYEDAELHPGHQVVETD